MLCVVFRCLWTANVGFTSEFDSQASGVAVEANAERLPLVNARQQAQKQSNSLELPYNSPQRRKLDAVHRSRPCFLDNTPPFYRRMPPYRVILKDAARRARISVRLRQVSNQDSSKQSKDCDLITVANVHEVKSF